MYCSVASGRRGAASAHVVVKHASGEKVTRSEVRFKFKIILRLMIFMLVCVGGMGAADVRGQLASAEAASTAARLVSALRSDDARVL